MIDTVISKKEKQNNFVYVAKIKIREDVSQLYLGVGGALAPLGFLLTPLMQDFNMMNRRKDLNHEDFLSMIDKRVNKIDGIIVEIKDEYIDLYCSLEKYKNSTYSDIGFLEAIYKQKFLPIRY